MFYESIKFGTKLPTRSIEHMFCQGDTQNVMAFTYTSIPYNMSTSHKFSNTVS